MGVGRATSRPLVARGAAVHAVDMSAAMLRVAARRAPRATFERADIRTYVPHEPFDAVLCAFVLHELTVEDTPAVLSGLALALKPGGQLAVLDHAVPDGGGVWRAVLRVVESARIEAWLSFDVAGALRHANLVIEEDLRLAGGCAQMVVARLAG